MILIKTFIFSFLLLILSPKNNQLYNYKKKHKYEHKKDNFYNVFNTASKKLNQKYKKAYNNIKLKSLIIYIIIYQKKYKIESYIMVKSINQEKLIKKSIDNK